MAVELAERDNIAVDVAYLKTLSNEIESTKIKEKLLYGAARTGITYTKSLQDYYDMFMAGSTDDDHKDEITEKYSGLIKLTKGQPSPKFVNYENHKGGTTSLDDLKGKYVYVDVWATWCGPCIRQIPFLKEIENKYHDKNIVFVSMSVDAENDHEKWKQMVEEKELGGIQLFADNSNKSQFYTDYGIVGIPRFILIDPEGNIVDSGAPPPSSSNLVKLFDELEI
jgi:thiol-disulfide isomerase/thioredoxin